MDFRLLGPLEVADHERALALGGVKQRSLLALLLLHANEAVAADQPIGELWGEVPPATACKSIQSYVLRSGREVSAERLTTCAPGYGLNVEADELDVAVLRALFRWSLTATGS
jgi:DNA-binding SARP family transcriptional activator